MSTIFFPEDIEFRESVRVFMDDCFITSDISEDAFNFIQDVHHTRYSKARAALLYAPTDTGKSAIINHYTNKYYEKYYENYGDYDTKPILIRKIQKGQTVKSLMDGLLRDLDDPAPNKGSLEEKYLRLQVLAETRGLTLVIFDDFTRLLKGSGTRTNEEVAYFIQSLLDDVFKVPILLTGVVKSKGMVKQLLEFDRRTPLKHAMRKYGCGSKKQCLSFKLFMYHLQTTIPVKTVDLSSEFMLKRIFYATGGVPGAIKTLIERAILGRKNIKEKLTIPDFANAFNAIHEISPDDDKYVSPRKNKLDEERDEYVPEFNPFNEKITQKQLDRHLDWNNT